VKSEHKTVVSSLTLPNWNQNFDETLIKHERIQRVAVLLSTSSGQYVNVAVWNMHFNYLSFGPRAACNSLCDNEKQIMAGEMNLGMGGEGIVGSIKSMGA
jgi:hypothetical protein